MVLNGVWNGKPLAIAARTDGLTVSIGELSAAQVYSFDLAGRLWTVYERGTSYRRGLDGRMLAKRRESGQPRERWWLSPSKVLDIERDAHATIRSLCRAIDEGHANFSTPLPQRASLALHTVLAFDEQQSRLNVEMYHRVYKPIGILPPDQYMSVVIQLTEGCSFNTCTFCDFYKDRPFYIKSPDELHDHVSGIKALLGEGLSLRRSIFLADANALVVPMKKLIPLLDIVQDEFAVEDRGGWHAFLDAFSGDKKSPEEYRELKRRGLRRIYLGLESGSRDLLTFLQKPGTAKQAIQAVQSMKAGGIAVGVIVLLGAGGKEYASDHIAETIKTVNAMQLGDRDILYLSDLVVSEGMAYARNALDAGLSALTSDERIQQAEEIVGGLRYPGSHASPKISRYDIREFVY